MSSLHCFFTSSEGSSAEVSSSSELSEVTGGLFFSLFSFNVEEPSSLMLISTDASSTGWASFSVGAGFFAGFLVLLPRVGFVLFFDCCLLSFSAVRSSTASAADCAFSPGEGGSSCTGNSDFFGSSAFFLLLLPLGFLAGLLAAVSGTEGCASTCCPFH